MLFWLNEHNMSLLQIFRSFGKVFVKIRLLFTNILDHILRILWSFRVLPTPFFEYFCENFTHTQFFISRFQILENFITVMFFGLAHGIPRVPPPRGKVLQISTRDSRQSLVGVSADRTNLSPITKDFRALALVIRLIVYLKPYWAHNRKHLQYLKI